MFQPGARIFLPEEARQYLDQIAHSAVLEGIPVEQQALCGSVGIPFCQWPNPRAAIFYGVPAQDDSSLSFFSSCFA